MPFYRVLIEGNNLRISGEKGAPGIAGFFTTRIVYATSRHEAEDRALASVRSEWQEPKYAKQPGAQNLSLAVSEVGKSGFIQWLRAPNKGHTFFSAASPGEA